MKNEAFKYPANRFGGYLPDRIPEPSDTRFYNDVVIHGFNDFMTNVVIHQLSESLPHR